MVLFDDGHHCCQSPSSNRIHRRRARRGYNLPLFKIPLCATEDLNDLWERLSSSAHRPIRRAGTIYLL